MSEQPYRYWAFISYSHHDVRAAEQLHRWLERYAVPRRLVGRASPAGPLPRRLFPIFRDRDELPSSAELGGVINRALGESRYLIVLCSPEAAKSRWVNEEIRQFKALGRADRVLALIVDGEPNARDPQRECFPPALLCDEAADGVSAPIPVEPIAADARREGDGEVLARMKLVSGLLNVGLDELLRRERRRRIRRRIGWAAGIAAVIALAATSLAIQRDRFRETERLRRLAQLVENGRRELLAGSQMRAAVFLSAAYSEGVDTPALRFMLHQAMQPIDALNQVIDSGAPVLKLKLSGDDHTLVTLSSAGELRAWSLPDAKPIARFPVLDVGGVQSYCGPTLSEDGRRVALASIAASGDRGVLKVWSLPDGELLLDQAIAAMNCSMASPFNRDASAIVAIAPDERPRVWSLNSGVSWAPPTSMLARTSVASFSPDGQWLAAGNRDGSVWLWKYGEIASARRLIGLNDVVIGVDFSAAGDLLVASSDDGAMRGWDLPDAKVAFAGGHAQQVYRVELASRAKRLLSSGLDGERVWRTDTGGLLYAGTINTRTSSALRSDGEQLCKIDWRQAVIADVVSSKPLFRLDTDTTSALFTRGGTQLLSADSAGNVMLWSDHFRPLASATHGNKKGEPPTWWSASVDFTQISDGRLVSGGQDGRLLLWSARDLTPLRSLGELSAAITTIASDGTRVAAASVAGEIGVWDVTNQRELLRLHAGGVFVSTLLMSRDGRYLFSGDRSNKGKLWRIDDGQMLSEYAMDSRFAADFSPDSRHLAIGQQREVQLIELASLTVEQRVPLSNDSPLVGCVNFAADSKQLVAMADDASGVVRLLSTQQPQQRQTVVNNSTGCFKAEFSHDGKKVLLEGTGLSATIWEPETGRLLKVGEHAGTVFDARWSADDRFVVTAGTDGLAQLSDASSGILLQNLAIHAGQVTAVAFSADDGTVYSAADDGRLRSWDARLESRPASSVADRLACISPWRLEGVALVQRPLNLGVCFGKVPSP
ncbi:toll/interleukin-1 receptor domain-containing protein [Hydrocarboniphaga sp.]|uniref:toll/interleukin-1 receptor domain-containing protein n=1 Tax=Hydrocarboniphaga sp. TaxID=2033016 RepID=UPI003D14200F